MDATIAATARQETGRGANRRQRRDGKVPAVVYGTGEATPIACSARDMLARLQDESFHSTVLTIDLEGRKIPALLREVQMHPHRREIVHLDFQAVKEDQEISANVPLHFVNVESSAGVRLRHAIFTSIENQVAVHCLPQNLPEFINVDVSGMDIGSSIHLSELSPPQGVRFDAIVRGEDPALAVMSSPAEEKEETAEEAPAAAEGAAEESKPE